MAQTLFYNGFMLDVVQGIRRDGVEVLVEDKVIVEISDRPIKAPDAHRIDLQGRTLMPGLIDAHAHAIAIDVNLGNLPNIPVSLVAHEAADLLRRMLARGFTTLRDAGGADKGLAIAVERDLIAGPRMFVAGKALSQTGGHGDSRSVTADVGTCACAQAGAELSRIADGVTEVRRAARDELRKGADQIKIMASGGISSPNDPVWNLQYAEEEVRAIVEEAKAWRTYVMAHAYTPEAIRRSIEFGVRSIEHANLIDADTAAFATKHGAYVVPTLATYDAMEQFGKSAGMSPVNLAKVKDVSQAGRASLEILKAAGTKVGFGTDLLGVLQVHQSDEFRIRAEVLSPIDVLRQATINNADLLNRAGQLGVIAVGAQADLLVVDGDPLANIHLLCGQGEHLTLIMKAGKIYKTVH
jgi:imidazolonepropionase-like amidohydrolase